MRFVLVTCFALMPAAGMAANADCAVLGDIVTSVALERAGGAEMNDAMTAVAESYTGDKERFVPAIPLLADWVYTLPDDQLTAEAGTAYQKACEAQ